jgi:hypothetical protein
VEIVGPQRQNARVTGRKVHEPNQSESHLKSHSRTPHMPGDTERMVTPSPPSFPTSPHPTFSFPPRPPCASFPPQQRSQKTNRPSPYPGTTLTFTGTCGSRRKFLSWKRTLNWPQRKTPRTCPTRSPSLHNFRGYDSILSPSQLPSPLSSSPPSPSPQHLPPHRLSGKSRSSHRGSKMFRSLPRHRHQL